MRYNPSVAEKVTKWAKRMQLTLTEKFSRSHPIAFLRFPSLFRTACGQNSVHEGVPLYFFQVFLHGQVYDHLVSKISGTTKPVDATDLKLFRSHPKFLRYLLQTYATDEGVIDAHEDVICYRQSSKMT